jgi:hypothetical protein
MTLLEQWVKSPMNSLRAPCSRYERNVNRSTRKSAHVTGRRSYPQLSWRSPPPYLLPVDWSPLVRMAAAAAVLVAFKVGRAYQDQPQERGCSFRGWFEFRFG